VGALTLSAFTASCRVPRDSLERLAEVGAFDSLDTRRRDALWNVLDRTARSQDLLVEHCEEHPAFHPLSEAEEITWDYLASDQSSRGHLMEQHRQQLRREGLPDAAEVSRMAHGHKVSLAGCAICRQMPGTASGVLFMTLEDETGFANLVVWEKVYRQYRTLILTNWLIGVTGHLQIAEGVVHIIAESFWVPDFIHGQQRQSAPSSHDFR
ncbi:MAG TPA: OB-fold nucleic acid binding domain-containing protein, partial [Spirochaetia bacterium]|nr:OB-fold nucleic acid binding domain-containing protein [Spirochaetia bacterium]